MVRTRVGFLIVGIAMTALSASPASAGRKSFFVDPLSVTVDHGAGQNLNSGGLAGISLPNSGSPDFGFGFVIPRGYKKNSPIRIIFNWQTAATSCVVRLEPEFVDRSRVAHASTAAFGESEGLVAEDSILGLQAASPALTGNVKVYTVSPGQGFDQLSGDAILVSFVRNAGHPNDDCADDMIISGITVEYATP